MKDKKRKEHGFTLIELLIVMVILGLLAALVGPRMFGKVGKSKQKAAKAQISLFETSLDTYRLDTGKYPTTDYGLKALRAKPEDMDKWDGPYKIIAGPVGVNSTGCQLQKFGQKRYVLFGSKDRIR